MSLSDEPAVYSKAACRDLLIDLVERELVGPKEPAESLTEAPHHRYVVGQLAPISEDMAADEETIDPELPLEEADVLNGTEDAREAVEIDSDSAISRARSQSLSSIGISFVAKPGASVDVTIRWGEYEKVAANGSFHFERRQREATLKVDFPGYVDLQKKTFGRAEVRWVARTTGPYVIASVFLANATKADTKDGTERIYQVAIELRGSDRCRPFLSRTVIHQQEPELEDLLYRDRREYGVGLHTAVLANDVEPSREAAGTLKTVVMPRVETFVTQSRTFSDDGFLSMRKLAELDSGPALGRELRSAFDEYRKWIAELERTIPRLEESLQPIARRQLREIHRRISRLNEGLSLLENRKDVFLAFRFANEAMARARFRQENPRKNLDTPWVKAMSGSWRPFQLAFLLSEIPEIVDPDNENRDVVDVLFFPTGGGKTEAYLALTAFVLAWRRIGASLSYGGAGTGVLMRYTLRLLTAQQFARAASLILAAELMRKSCWQDGALGSAPFSIGLWVGPMTPSKFDTALQSLKEARRSHNHCSRSCELSKAEKDAPRSGKDSADSDFLVLTECPWCSHLLCVECVVEKKNPDRIEIICGNQECPFSASGKVTQLPVWFVDSDVYRVCPSLLIGTVDKFATLPYRGEAKGIFGNVRGYCSTCGFYSDMVEHKKGCGGERMDLGPTRALDLVIQDELHTINDNIGSVYGLYETAIEFLIAKFGNRPKYIAATATVKDVDRQARQLYGGRGASVFPPVGLDAGDTFFSRDVQPTREEPGRAYVGIYAPTKSRLTTFVAALSSILSSAWECRERFGVKEADPYLTMLGYFNTIRDLGAVKSLLADDVPPVLERIAKENGWPTRPLGNFEDELTGRIGSGEVPQRLAFLSKTFDGDDGCHFMACTNMVSVGVDVPRLGLIIVDGQPKSTAEYIQATSRVGRASPGVVFVVYNAMRPRDVSHYEHFFVYHLSYYRYVEAGSVTPFSDGCLQRYLGGAYVAGYRLSDTDSSNSAANRFKSDASGASGSLATAFSDRAERFGPHEVTSVVAGTDRIIERWSNCQENLQYARPTPPPGVRFSHKQLDGLRPVVVPPEGRKEDKKAPEDRQALFVAPRSMRNVEEEVPLKVANYGE